jgi:hypothetical protein
MSGMGMLGAPFRRFSELTFVLLIRIVFLDNGSLIDDRRLPLFCSASTCFCCRWSVAIDKITILLVVVPMLVPSRRSWASTWLVYLKVTNAFSAG